MSISEIINLVALVLLSAPFALLVTQAVKRLSWKPRWRFLLAAVVGILVGLAQCWVNGSLGTLIDHWGSLTALEVVAQVGLVWAAAQAWYAMWLADVPWMKRLAEWPGTGDVSIGLDE